MNHLLLIAMCAILGSAVVHADKEKCQRGRGRRSGIEVCVKVKGKSGGIMIWVKGQENKKKVDVSFHEVKKGKAKKQGSESFTGFQFSATYETKIANLNATCFNSTSTVPALNSNFNMPICIFKENGTIPLCRDEEEVEIREGMVKFNFELTKNCNAGNCANDDGADDGAEISIEIKSPKGLANVRRAKKRGRKAAKLTIGGNNDTTTFDAPKSIVKDGQCDQMPEGYPKFEIRGSRLMMIFSFPKFNDKIVYDPSVNMDGEDSKDGESVDNPPDNASASVAASTLFVALAASLYWLS